jgi:hypothetical protein
MHPSDQVKKDFEAIVTEMMNGFRGSTIDLRSLDGKFDIGDFTDQDNGKDYCILASKYGAYP